MSGVVGSFVCALSLMSSSLIRRWNSGVSCNMSDSACASLEREAMAVGKEQVVRPQQESSLC